MVGDRMASKHTFLTEPSADDVPDIGARNPFRYPHGQHVERGIGEPLEACSHPADVRVVVVYVQPDARPWVETRGTDVDDGTVRADPRIDPTSQLDEITVPYTQDDELVLAIRHG